MKKTACIFLTIIMLLSMGAPAFAAEEKALTGEGLALTTYVEVDRDVAKDILTPANLGEKGPQLADLLLTVANAVRHDLIINNDGIEYQLFLKDTKLLDVAAGIDEKGIIILNSLIPDHAVIIPPVILEVGRAASNLITSFKTLQRYQREAVEQEVMEAVNPYIDRFVRDSSSAIRFEAPQTGTYDFGDNVTYNTRTQIDVDLNGILKGLNDTFQDIIRDSGLLKVLGYLGVTEKDLQDVKITVDNPPFIDLAVYSNMNKNGMGNDSDMWFTFSAAPSKEEKAGISLEVHTNKGDSEVYFGIPGSNDENSIYASAHRTLYDERTGGASNEIAMDLMGNYLALRNTVMPSDDDSSLALTNQFYFLKSEKPLATAYSYTETEGVPRVDLNIGDKREVTYQDLFSTKRISVFGDMFRSAQNGLEDMLNKAVDAVPELGELLNELSGENTGAAN